MKQYEATHYLKAAFIGNSHYLMFIVTVAQKPCRSKTANIFFSPIDV